MFTTVSYLVSRLPELDDEGAWAVFEKRYTPVLQRYFRRGGCGVEMANDLAQDTIHRVMEGLRRGRFCREAGRLRDWTGGIARNVLRNQRRRMTSRRDKGQLRTEFWDTQEDVEAAGEQCKADARFDAIWVRARLSALLRLAAESFDLRDLRCYFLVEVRKLPIREVARRVGLSEASVFQKRRQVANWLLAVGPRFVSRWEQ